MRVVMSGKLCDGTTLRAERKRRQSALGGADISPGRSDRIQKVTYTYQPIRIFLPPDADIATPPPVPPFFLSFISSPDLRSLPLAQT